MLAILSYIGIILLLINSVAYFLRFKNNNSAYKCFTVYLVGIFIIQTATVGMALNGLNNLFLSGYYLFYQFILLSLFFYRLLLPSDRKKADMVKYASGITLAGLILHYVLDPAVYYTVNTTGFLITSILLIGYCLLYLFELLSKKSVFNYITIGIFIYLISSTLVFFSTASALTATLSDDMFYVLWIINIILFNIYQLLILWEWKQHFFYKTIK
ncbi:hypothetical protein [Flavobacterium psychrotrophum]|uniref:hypothetical protein n=1 Tax=Flavobacterium psychrotrophum TaxID=2294119 RepID=UPI000E31210D|nr:hypothetical protein [Flavobacterium psychrotrophum]